MGRSASGVMTGMENAAGRAGGALLAAFSTRQRRRVVTVAALAVLLGVGSAGTVKAAGDALHRDAATLALLRAEGVEVAAPVVDKVTTLSGRGGKSIDVLFRMPPEAGGRVVTVNNQRLPDREVSIGETVDVVYARSDPSVVRPARVVTDEVDVRADRQTRTAGRVGLALTPLPALLAAVLWRRERRRGPDEIVDDEPDPEPDPEPGPELEPAPYVDQYDEAPRDAADRDARLRALPGGRAIWAYGVLVTSALAVVTGLFVAQAVSASSSEPLGFAVLFGLPALCLAALVHISRAALSSAEPEGFSRPVYAAAVAGAVLAMVLFAIGIVAGGPVAVCAYVASAAITASSYLVMRRG